MPRNRKDPFTETGYFNPSVALGASQGPLPYGLLPPDLRGRRFIQTPTQNGRENQALGYYGNAPLPLPMVPADMRPRRIAEYQIGPGGIMQEVPAAVGPAGGVDYWLQKIASDTDKIASTLILRRGLLGRTVVVQTTPTLLVTAQFLRGYIFLNPATTTGLTSAGTLRALATDGASTATLTGNTSTLGVANFLNLHLYIRVTSVVGGGTITLTAQTLDPTSLAWFDSQVVLPATGAATDTYVDVGSFGVATDFRIRWAITAGTDVTFSIGFVLKEGLSGTSSGVNQTIFLGTSGVTTSNGYPLLEGKEKDWWLMENVQLFGIANSPLPIRIFEL